MSKVLSYRIESYICIVGFIFLADVALYSVLPEFFEITKVITKSFWFANFTVLFVSLGLLTSNLLINKRAKYVMININAFMVIIGVLQQFIIFGADVPKLFFVILCPMYALSMAITFKYVSN